MVPNYERTYEGAEKMNVPMKGRRGWTYLWRGGEDEHTYEGEERMNIPMKGRTGLTYLLRGGEDERTYEGEEREGGRDDDHHGAHD